jgi:glucose-1-phosphate thymidylyltransferase
VNAVVLAAGYATRLYPLTRDRPKHLLQVAGRPILEHVLEKLAPMEGLESLVVVTNAKFAGVFRQWAEGYDPPRPELAPMILDDGTSTEESRLGAIGDLRLLIERGLAEDDLVVVAGDNLFSESLEGFGAYGRRVGKPVVGVYDVGDLEAIRRYNAIQIDDDGRITYFEEKPENPRSTLTGIALYYYPRETLELVPRYLDEGNNPDQPGRLVQWLYPRVECYTWRVPGVWLDVGSKETLASAEELLAESSAPGRASP